ncbi:MAG: NnrS family protein [Deltaproteobacteria bacterium]|nr:NnrS family protein [Deltaproteobacteria bacterium]MBW2392793.1 NnrS family protein [Deltaproteobacteria bacterium]
MSSKPAPDEPTALPAALFALGFRPFFLAAGVAAIILVATWVAALRGVALPTVYDPVGGPMAWHGHEMLFGYVSAVIAGFLLTSVRNWTGQPTPTGPRLVGLAALWLAGRVAPFLPASIPPAWAAGMDLAFLPALTLALAIPLLRQGAARNLVFVPILLALTAANVMFHLQVLGIAATGRTGQLLAVDLIVLVITIIGGRVLPFFIDRALPEAHPVTRPGLDALCVAAVVALAVLRLLGADDALRVVAGLAAALHAARLAGWHDARLWSKPLLWVLYLGYAWLVVGFAMTALSGVMPRFTSLALHAFTAGAMGSMTLGMMTRVSLGHTGRPLVASGAALFSFVAILAAGLIRVLIPAVAPSLYNDLIAVAGLLWIAAFLPFVAAFGPILIRPRPDGRAG